MPLPRDWPDLLAPLALGLLVAAIVLAVNLLGRRVGRHDDLLRRLELRVDNLHRDRAFAHARSLRAPGPRDTVLPPPLSEAKTVEVSEDMLSTLVKESRKR